MADEPRIPHAMTLARSHMAAIKLLGGHHEPCECDLCLGALASLTASFVDLDCRAQLETVTRERDDARAVLLHLGTARHATSSSLQREARKFLGGSRPVNVSVLEHRLHEAAARMAKLEAAGRVIDGLMGEIDRAEAHFQWVRDGSKGQRVSFHGDFASANPGVMKRLYWWRREWRTAWDAAVKPDTGNKTDDAIRATSAPGGVRKDSP